jgi:hypothetical protein
MRLIAALFFCLLTVSACTDNGSDKISLSADRRALQTEAMSACECSLTGERSDCWVRYRKMTAPFRPQGEAGLGEGATACAPVSTQDDCMKDAKGVFCVTTGYYVNGVDLEQPRLCRLNEAQAVERGFNKGFSGPNGSQAKAEREVRAALAAERAGKAMRTSSPSSGCV